MSRNVRKAMLDLDHAKLSLSRQCRLVAISRSSLCYRPRPANEETLALMRRIDEIYLACPFFGGRQIMRQLHTDGRQAGRHRVRRLMRQMGLQAIYQAPKTSGLHPAHRIYPYLFKDLAIERPNQVWCADITYIPVQRGHPCATWVPVLGDDPLAGRRLRAIAVRHGEGRSDAGCAGSRVAGGARHPGGSLIGRPTAPPPRAQS